VRSYLILLASVFAIAAIGSAQCAPSFRGYTGLVVIPTCDTLGRGDYNFGVMTEKVNDIHANDIFVNYGAAENLEIGFNSLLQVEGEDRETLINGKYQFLSETEQRAGVACGITDLTNEMESTAYVVASKTIGRGMSIFDNEIVSLRGHAGVGGGSLDGVFAGISAFFGNRVMFSFEWDSKDPNFGFRISPSAGLRIHAGWFDVGKRDDIGAGLSFQKSY